jgi:16S rRNA (cytidine1402-2'-O)-methyltransferase
MNQPTPGTLHLLPVPLGENEVAAVLPQHALTLATRLDYFIVENEKSARHFLKTVNHPRPLRELTIELFDKSGTSERADQLLQPLRTGRDAAVLSEAGCPAVADPGALLVAAAHRAGVRVQPQVGPSSLILALMASGFNGQCFSFHGYLPVAIAECRLKIAALERESRERDMTQIFIETPYRNDALLKTLLETCDGGTRLCAASDLTSNDETILSSPIRQWRSRSNAIGRRPTVFLLYAH